MQLRTLIKMVPGLLLVATIQSPAWDQTNQEGLIKPELTRNSGDLDTSVKLPTRHTAGKTADAEIYFRRALAHDRLHLDDQAISDYTKVVRLHPQMEAAYNNRGTAYYRQGEYSKAVKDFSRAIELNPSYALAYYNRGNAYHDKGDLDRSMADFNRAIEFDPTNAAAYNNRGRLLLQRQQTKAAIKDFSLALQLNPEYTLAYYNRGNARRTVGNNSGAIEDFSKAIKTDPQHVQAYFQRGNAYLAKDDLDHAIKDYDAALRINPAHADIHSNRGWAIFRKGDSAQALCDITKAIYLNPHLASAYSNRGLVYKDRRECAKAILDFNRALELDPTAAAVYAYRSACYFDMGQPLRAMIDMKRVESINSSKPQILLTELRKQSGRDDTHERAWNSLAEHGMNNNPVAKGLKLHHEAEAKAAILNFLAAWKSAWEQKDLERYVGMYHPEFHRGNMDYTTFLKSKENFFRKYRTIHVETEQVEIKDISNRILVKFIQSFQGDDYHDEGWKSMVLTRDKEHEFKIVQEKWSPAKPVSQDSGN
ncbi:MAG TPA: tetratricopeptide repeat protein [Desulfomonilaceae bacterium]|nr:tetratricopeptide repeat protein [Desulfomonilaceae bacterium]